ncbi:MAG: hypothetical protein ABH919_00215 [bacterium]
MKQKSLTKQVLEGLLAIGAICVAASSPYFALQAPKIIFRELKKKKYLQEKNNQFNNAFYYMRRKGYLDIQEKNKQIYISLTADGRKKADKYTIDNLEIQKQKHWDGKYRIIIFDIPDATRVKREAFRGKLKELGFHQLQKSVWVHLYDCQKEIKFLRDFFGLTSKELRLITGKIDDDESLRKVLGV